MRETGKLRRFYTLLGGCCLVAVAYYLTITLPLIQKERELDARLLEAVDRLAVAGHGMSQEAVAENIARIEEDIAAFAEIGQDKARTVRFSPEVERVLDTPFQRIDFDHRKFLMIDRIRDRSAEKEVNLFDGWEQAFPSPGMERPYQLWAQLTVMDQLWRTAIETGVESIDGATLLSIHRNESHSEAALQELEVSVRMQLTGPMEAIHNVMMMLPLNGEELEALGMSGVAEPKSSFFLGRFILKKSSVEDADEVSLDFVASGFLDADPSF